MNKIGIFSMSFFLSIFLFCQVAFSQNIVLLSPSPNGTISDVYETADLSFFKAEIDASIEWSAALRYYLMQEIIASDPSILGITRSKDANTGVVVFSIVTNTGLSAATVEAMIDASLMASNTFLLDYKTQNNLTPAQLTSYIKSDLLNN